MYSCAIRQIRKQLKHDYHVCVFTYHPQIVHVHRRYMQTNSFTFIPCDHVNVWGLGGKVVTRGDNFVSAADSGQDHQLISAMSTEQL